MKKYLFFIFLVLDLIVANFVFADVVPPEYLFLRCPTDKIEVTCSELIEMLFISGMENCKNYKINPSCKILKSHNRTDTYCCEPDFENLPRYYLIKIQDFVFVLLITLLFELSVFWLFGLRKKRELFMIFLANFVSLLAFYISSFWFSGLNYILISELIIIIFEIIFFKKTLKEFGTRKIALATIVANFVSATIGTFLGLLISM